MVKQGAVHLAAFNSTLAAVAGLQQVGAVADPVLPRVNGNLEYQMPGAWKIAAGYGGAAANVRTRLTTPSLALRGNPQVVPFSGTLLPPVDPNFWDQTAAPIELKSQEALRADMESNSATAALVALWLLGPGHEFKVHHRDLRWLRATATITTVANVWAGPGTIVFDDPLEGGQYAVYGMQAFFATALLARLIFPDQVMRPGCLCGATAPTSRTAPAMYGGLGLWGIFDTFSLPQLEVMDTAAAAVSYTLWILLAKVGDTMLPRLN